MLVFICFGVSLVILRKIVMMVVYLLNMLIFRMMLDSRNVFVFLIVYFCRKLVGIRSSMMVSRMLSVLMVIVFLVRRLFVWCVWILVSSLMLLLISVYLEMMMKNRLFEC